MFNIRQHYLDDRIANSNTQRISRIFFPKSLFTKRNKNFLHEMDAPPLWNFYSEGPFSVGVKRKKNLFLLKYETNNTN